METDQANDRQHLYDTIEYSERDRNALALHRHLCNIGVMSSLYDTD